MTSSLLPPDIQFLDQETEPSVRPYKCNKTNTTTADLPYSTSEKTLNFHSTYHNHKSLYKSDKTKKKRKNKTSKYDIEMRISEKEIQTTRKSTSKKPIFEALLRKTDRVLKKYQKREE